MLLLLLCYYYYTEHGRRHMGPRPGFGSNFGPRPHHGPMGRGQRHDFPMHGPRGPEPFFGHQMGGPRGPNQGPMMRGPHMGPRGPHPQHRPRMPGHGGNRQDMQRGGRKRQHPPGQHGGKPPQDKQKKPFKMNETQAKKEQQTPQKTYVLLQN